jgi:hypothetical protein
MHAIKIISHELPLYGLKLVGIPPNEIAGYCYLAGALRLDSSVVFPIELMRANMAELYRGVADGIIGMKGVMYSDTNEEGSNSSWEAEACGLRVIHRKDSPKEIAEAILNEIEHPSIKPVARDIKETAKKMIEVLEVSF